MSCASTMSKTFFDSITYTWSRIDAFAKKSTKEEKAVHALGKQILHDSKLAISLQG